MKDENKCPCCGEQGRGEEMRHVYGDSNGQCTKERPITRDEYDAILAKTSG